MESIESKLRAFLKSSKLTLLERIGFGIHGQVFAVHGSGPLLSVVKVFESEEQPYQREREVYLRLRAMKVTYVEHCAVPQLIAADDDQRTGGAYD